MFATPVGNPTMNIRVAQIRGALTKISIQKIFLSLPDAALNIYIYVNIYMVYGIEVTHYTESAQLNRSKVSKIYIYIYIYIHRHLLYIQIYISKIISLKQKKIKSSYFHKKLCGNT